MLSERGYVTCSFWEQDIKVHLTIYQEMGENNALHKGSQTALVPEGRSRRETGRQWGFLYVLWCRQHYHTVAGAALHKPSRDFHLWKDDVLWRWAFGVLHAFNVVCLKKWNAVKDWVIRDVVIYMHKGLVVQVLIEHFRSLNSTRAAASGWEEQEEKSNKGPARVPAAARHTTVAQGLAAWGAGQR